MQILHSKLSLFHSLNYDSVTKNRKVHL
jgi:hypothetical protein